MDFASHCYWLLTSQPHPVSRRSEVRVPTCNDLSSFKLACITLTGHTSYLMFFYAQIVQSRTMACVIIFDWSHLLQVALVCVQIVHPQTLGTSYKMTSFCLQIVHAHTLGISCKVVYVCVQIVHSRTLGTAAAEGGIGTRVLLPAVDFLNHGGDQYCGLRGSPRVAADSAR